MRKLSIALIALSALPVAAVAEQASTTRIEPRPYYGATVTIEEGVRVFRPLPPHKHVVINPGNRTPVNLSFEERTERSYNYNYHYGEDRPVYGGYGGYGGYGLPYGYGGHGKGRDKGPAPGGVIGGRTFKPAH